MHPAEVYVLAARRTPVGRPGGQFGALGAERLGAAVLAAAAAPALTAGLSVAEVILGNTVGPGGNMARLSLLEAGLPVEVPGMTIDRQCGSGLDAVYLAALRVQAGIEGGSRFGSGVADSHFGSGPVTVLAGGTESVSTSPMLRRQPNGIAYVARAPMAPAVMGDPDMAEAAEIVADRYGVTRRDQDDWACLSISRAREAAKSGRLGWGITPVTGIAHDEWRDRRIRPEALARFPPLTRLGSTVTAANTAPPADGAAALLVGNRWAAEEAGIRPLARIAGYAAIGVAPDEPGMGPVPALRAACRAAGLQPADLARVEINEAFAAKVLACMRELDLSADRVNPDGGAIALGHPFGATGAILLVRLLAGLGPGEYGAVTLGIGGGLGVAMVLEGM